ncbi:DNA polymerase III subunit delta [Caldimonas thermodepolymerans]|jgi:DNA polymerase III, delta subunit|uniref:DNA polymerase III subunit delta n=1 Tax=Caldimonas thermodepolymerans TaxID=215580 RepID=A0A2S5T433_9BURK|nr:DNA polymerase III subunit delta [Caldimonas thermodepolymerans]PPE69658.1 DNA polymerase III subunit delta [Caldimonas thermodepolymerans]QPC31933.1 DNA polymerase III subunit delta [Caldimonas thermodepolymerans]RDI01548.1 DNA polymerase III delta subunit [Caldimonas thermodepolymerans]TCP05004.1 DNA polymerase III delta subunit [Caldimonas thermodepolymerans]UZG44721.1 DNA polymerase III subunit delta [Caldimonas thermodepolymerans]
MQVRLDQLDAHLQRGLRPLYTIHGDEPLLAQEACDAIRAAARAAGHTERTVHTVVGAHFDWGGLLGAAQALSLFADRRLIEIRIPGGKPGKEGSEALQRYCEALSQDVVTLVVLPRLDKAALKSAWFTALDGAGLTVRVDPVERKVLPQWIAQRLAAQGQRVQPGEAGQRTLAFFADRVEGNLLAAHQEIQKLGLLYPAGELSFEQIEAAVLNVARYNVAKLSEAVLAGQTGRVLRILDGLEAEGEAPVLVHWTLAEDIRALKRVKDALAAGRPLPVALRDQRVWGVKEKLFERAVPRLSDTGVLALLDAAAICDGLVKGLKHPDWPLEPWAALRRLALMATEAVAGPTLRGRLALLP